MSASKQTIAYSLDKKPQKTKGTIKKIYNFLSKTLENTLGPKDDVTILMQMQSGHFGQLTSSHLARPNIRTNNHDKMAQMIPRQQEKTVNREEEDRLWKLQVAKCYRRIPISFFSEDCRVFSTMINRNRQKCLMAQMELTDYLDQVDFNLNSHVNNKFKELFTFITSMGEIEALVESNLVRIKTLRQSNQNLNRKMFQKAQKIRLLQNRVDNMKRLKLAAENTKRMINMPNDIRIAYLKDKNKSLYLFNLYRANHQKYQAYCCKGRKTCKFQETQQYLKSNLQQAFSKTIFSYLTEVITYDRADLQKVFKIDKKQFMTTPNVTSLLEKLKLDQSTWEQPQEIIVKDNIEHEISWIAMQTLTLGDLQSQYLIRDLLEFMNSFQKNFLSDLVDRIKESFDMPVLNNLLSLSKSQDTLITELEPLFERILLSKFITVVEQYMNIMKKVVRRCLSIVYKLLSSLIRQKHHKARNMEESVLEVANIILNFSGTGLLALVKLKKIPKDFQQHSLKEMLKIFEGWSEFAAEMLEIYLQPLMNLGANIEQTHAYLRSNALETIKKNYIYNYFIGLHQTNVGGRLKKHLESDTWQQIELEPSFFQSLAYIFQGQKFEQNRKKKIMASSILFERKNDTSSYKLPVEQFKLTNKEIIIKEKRLKVTTSTIELLDTLSEYVKIAQACDEIAHEIAQKVIQMLKSYIGYLEQLIIRGKALQFKRIKGNSITARHLCLYFLALDLILELLPRLANQLPFEQIDFKKLKQKVQNQQDDIIKKFHNVMIVTMEQQCRLVALKTPVPSQGTKKILDHLRSMYDILIEYFSQQDMSKFFSKHYLRKYVDTLIRLKPADSQEAYLKKQELSYFIRQASSYRNVLTEYGEIESEVKKLLSYQTNQ